jgi:hypothetical protein
MGFLKGLSRKQKIWLGIAGFVVLIIVIGSLAPGNDEAANTTLAATTEEGSVEAETTTEATSTEEISPEQEAAADLTSQAELARQAVEAALVDADHAGETKFLPSRVTRAYRAVGGFLSDGSISVQELKRARGPVRVLDNAADGSAALAAAIKANAAPKSIVLTGSGDEFNSF